MAKRARVADEFDLTLRGHPPFNPRGVKQFEYYKAMRLHHTVVGIGPAGAGKTYVAASFAAERIALGKTKKLVLTRPSVAIEGEEHGFLPGSLIQKMAPWTAPVVDVLVERLGREMVNSMLKDGRIEVVPIGFMRGRTFKDAVVLLDEAQNTTVTQMKSTLTRAGENTVYIVDGDPDQTDIGDLNGLEHLLHIINSRELPVPVVEFTERDIVRSEACRMWVEAYKDLSV